MNIKNLEEWSFNVFSFNKDELVGVVFEMFQRRGLIQVLGINKDHFLSFIQSVKDNYLENPYHNFHHGTSVLQFIYKMDNDGAFLNTLEQDERFALMLAALCHDVAHPGKNASYHKKRLSEIYERFGSISTLEKYHAEVTLTLLDDPDYDLLEGLDRDRLECLIKQYILATDMNLHSEYLKKIRDGEFEEPLHSGIIAIKCADLGLLVRDKPITEKWIRSLHKEQYLQRELEVQKGIAEDVTDEDFIRSVLREQELFISKYANPIYEELGNTFPCFKELKKHLQNPIIS